MRGDRPGTQGKRQDRLDKCLGDPFECVPQAPSCLPGAPHRVRRTATLQYACPKSPRPVRGLPRAAAAQGSVAEADDGGNSGVGQEDGSWSRRLQRAFVASYPWIHAGIEVGRVLGSTAGGCVWWVGKPAHT